MLQIFICESNPKHLAFIKKQIENYILMSNLALEITCADTKPATVLSCLEKKARYLGLYFLDIHLDGEHGGLDLAMKIREYDQRGSIVFLAPNDESYKLAFKHKIEALDYILKSDPYIKERIHDCLETVAKKLTSKAPAMTGNFVLKLSEDAISFAGGKNLAKDSIVSIEKDMILCFMTQTDSKHMVKLYTCDKMLSFYGSLKKTEAELADGRFYRCQSNLIINLDKVVALDPVQYTLLLESDLIVNIVPRRIQALGNRIKEYKSNYATLPAPGNGEEVYEIELTSVPLNDLGEPDIEFILSSHGLSHIDLQKAKILKINAGKDKIETIPWVTK